MTCRSAQMLCVVDVAHLVSLVQSPVAHCHRVCVCFHARRHRLGCGRSFVLIRRPC